MRLWHKDLIHYLPRHQLIAQWRECCAVCSNWVKKATPNHLLVNKVLNYPKIEFYNYTMLIVQEMTNRNYKISKISLSNFKFNYSCIPNDNAKPNFKNLFENWHNERYLKQCLFNLQEKYDCGGIPEDEWKLIQDNFDEYLD